MSISRMLPVALSAAIGMTALVAGAPSSRALTNEEIALLSGPNRQATLEEGAKKDGSVVWFCTLRSDGG